MVNDSQFVVARSQDAAEQPAPNQRGEHVIYASAQVIGVIVDFGVGKVDEIYNLNLDTRAGEDLSDHLKYFTDTYLQLRGCLSR